MGLSEQTQRCDPTAQKTLNKYEQLWNSTIKDLIQRLQTDVLSIPETHLFGFIHRYESGFLGSTYRTYRFYGYSVVLGLYRGGINFWSFLSHITQYDDMMLYIRLHKTFYSAFVPWGWYLGKIEKNITHRTPLPTVDYEVDTIVATQDATDLSCSIMELYTIPLPVAYTDRPHLEVAYQNYQNILHLVSSYRSLPDGYHYHQINLPD